MFINPLTSPKLINTLLSVYSSKGREWANAGNLFVWSQDSSAVKFAHAVLLTGFFTTGKWLMKTIKGNMEGKVMAENNNTRKHRAEFSGWCWSQHVRHEGDGPQETQDSLLFSEFIPFS